MGELSSPPDINKSLSAFNLGILGVHVEMHLKKGVPINIWESGSSPAPEPLEGKCPLVQVPSWLSAARGIWWA